MQILTDPDASVSNAGIRRRTTPIQAQCHYQIWMILWYCCIAQWGGWVSALLSVYVTVCLSALSLNNLQLLNIWSIRYVLQNLWDQREIKETEGLCCFLGEKNSQRWEMENFDRNVSMNVEVCQLHTCTQALYVSVHPSFWLHMFLYIHVRAGSMSCSIVFFDQAFVHGSAGIVIGLWREWPTGYWRTETSFGWIP